MRQRVHGEEGHATDSKRRNRLLEHRQILLLYHSYSSFRHVIHADQSVVPILYAGGKITGTEEYRLEG